MIWFDRFNDIAVLRVSRLAGRVLTTVFAGGSGGSGLGVPNSLVRRALRQGARRSVRGAVQRRAVAEPVLRDLRAVRVPGT